MTDKPTKIVYGTNIENQTNNITIKGNTFHGGNFYLTEEIEKAAKTKGRSEDPSSNGAIEDKKEVIWAQILELISNGPWAGKANEESIIQMMANCLGKGVELTKKEAEMSAILWKMLTSKGADRIKIVWANILGFMMNNKLVDPSLSAPKVMACFFGSKDKSDNINKGRNENAYSNDFREIVPLLKKFMPK